MKTSLKIAVLLSFLGLVLEAAAQAPGDHFDFCRTGLNAPRHDFPENWKILMDTYDYFNLFENFGAVWTSTSQDGDSSHVSA